MSLFTLAQSGIGARTTLELVKTFSLGRAGRIPRRRASVLGSSGMRTNTLCGSRSGSIQLMLDQTH